MPRRRRPPRTHTALRDILFQAAYGVAGRRQRSVLTVLGIALGIAAAVATTGITSTAAGALSGDFDAFKATQVSAQFPDSQQRPDASASRRALDIDGTVSGGFYCRSTRAPALSRLPASFHAETGQQINMVAAEPGALTALGVDRIVGRSFDEAPNPRVALLDAVAASALGLPDLSGPPQIFIDGVPFTVYGVFQAPAGVAQLTGAVVIPYADCQAASPAFEFGPTTIAVRTRLGAADTVGRQLPLAVHPEAPSTLAVMVPPDLASLRGGVEARTAALFLGLAAVSLLIGALGVSNTTLVSVMERRQEIGVRRAVGATRRAVAGQFLVESGLLGVLGGLIGTAVGTDVTLAVSLVQDWVVVLDPRIAMAGPPIGAVVGMLAGLYPALAAARIPPAETLRG
ncbi:ABC transporter permease [Streptomyces sp. NPDC059874]|uniref:ABC transporter permease n=1 Tax=Streptomyces sp. NPDC059874 TaxID=3346983 RepID=UPI003659A015